MSCRSGCRTKDHSTYAECLRSATPQVAGVINSPNQWMFEETKRDLSAYAQARREGIQPGGTSVAKVREAERASKLLGRPYDGSVDPPANMIVSKNTAKFVNWKE